MKDEVYNIIDNIENTSVVKRLKDVKNKILSSDKALSLIKRFNNAKELYEKYNNKEDFINNKKELMNNELIKEYLQLQNEINLLIIHINNRIKEITSIGGKNESNKW